MFKLLRTSYGLPLQIILPVIMLLAFMLAGVFLIFIPHVRSNYIARKREMIKNLTLSATSVLDSLNRQVESGHLTLAQGQEIAKTTLRELRYGEDNEDYFFVLGLDTITVMHPTRRDMEGQPTAILEDITGNRFGERMLELARTNGEGFVSYFWQKNQITGTFLPKVSYIKLYQPWGWIVGTGMYIDDIEHQLAALTRRILGVTSLALLVTTLLSFFIIVQARRLNIQRLQALDALTRNERKYRSLFENSPDATLILRESVILDCNYAALSLFGAADKNDLLNARIEDMSAPEQEARSVAEAVHDTLSQVRERGSLRFEWLHRRCDGTPFPVEVSITIIPEETQLLYYAVMRDITERKQAETALVESNQLLKNLIDNSPAVIWMKDPQGRYRMVNRQYERIFGLRNEDISGKTDFDIFPPQTAAKMRSNYEQVLRTGELLRSDTEVMHDDHAHTFLSLVFPIRNREGLISGVCCVATEITERKELERQLKELNETLEQKVQRRTAELAEANTALRTSLEQLQRTKDQLVESEKMAALGNLVAGVAHEINTPVGVGVTAASHLAEKIEGFERLYREERLGREEFEQFTALAGRTCQILLKNLRRAADQISSFKRIAVDQSTEDEREFNLHEYVREILLSLHPKLHKTRHHVSLDCREDLYIRSYPGALAQILTNLIMNSLIHGFAEKDAGEIGIIFKLVDSAVVLHYSDNGCGIPPENQKKIFEPFFTTRPGQGGSGLGLHITYNLVTRKLGGSISCHSEPGGGAEFVIEIPLVKYALRAPDNKER